MRILSMLGLALLAAPAFAAGGALPKAAETPDGQVVAGQPVQARPAPVAAKKTPAAKKSAAAPRQSAGQPARKRARGR